EVLLDDHPVRFATVTEALRAGVSLIHQELNLAENLSVSANLVLGRETLWAGPLGFLDRRAMDRDARTYLARLGLDCDPATRVEVLRDGKNAGGLAREQISHANLVRLMVGRELSQFFQKHPVHIPPGTPPSLEVKEVCYEGGPATPVSFALRPGEIVGLAGLV